MAPRGVKNPLWFQLADRLKVARAARSITFIALGARSGVAANAIANIERGTAQPSIDTVERIAAALGASACWLAFGSDGKERFTPRISRRGAELGMPPLQEPYALGGLFEGCPERLRIRREALRYTLRELGSLSGVSHMSIANIENGKQVPRVDSIHRLAVSLDVAPCWLAYGIGRKPTKARPGTDRQPAVES